MSPPPNLIPSCNLGRGKSLALEMSISSKKLLLHVGQTNVPSRWPQHPVALMTTIRPYQQHHRIYNPTIALARYKLQHHKPIPIPNHMEAMFTPSNVCRAKNLKPYMALTHEFTLLQTTECRNAFHGANSTKKRREE